jgi:hypothetical protein
MTRRVIFIQNGPNLNPLGELIEAPKAAN